MEIPPRLSDLLEIDRRLQGAVHKTLGDFEIWVADNKMPFFPAFTDHGTEHLTRVMRGADGLIEDAAWEHLTPRDVGCLLLAVVLHDCAMHLSKAGFVYLVNQSSSWRPTGLFCNKFKDAPWGDLWLGFLREATRWDEGRRIAIFDRVVAIRPPQLAWDATWDDDQYLLVGEFLRRHHARLAHEIAILGVPGTGDDRLRFTDMPEPWITDLAGLIARSHNMTIRNAVAVLEHNGRKAWRQVHVPYLMTLLRIADYLELDATRAPRDLLKVRSLRSPISRLEWKKHHAIYDIRPHEDDPHALFIDAEPSDIEIFLALRRLLEDLQREIDECWNVIGEVYGSDSKLRNLGFSIRRVHSSLDDLKELGERVNYIPVDARFRAAGGELLKLLVGPLYENDSSYGARELIQNAVDACRELEDWRSQHERVTLEQWDQPADVVVLVEEHEDTSATFTITDRGIGMTANTITDYFLTAGATFRNSDAWNERHVNTEGRPRVLRTGRFGVGALAAFLIGPELEVETRFVESAIGYRFVCRLDSPHVEIVKHACPVGTRIRIKMPAPNSQEEYRRHWTLIGGDNQLGEHWDWYAATKPTLARGVKHMFPRKIHDTLYPVGEVIWLETNSKVPQLGGELPPEWNAVEHPDYDAVHWSASNRRSLWCNGFKIRNRGDRSEMLFQFGDAYEIRLRYPALSLWDREGCLPLSLKRDALSAPLYFDDVLGTPVCRNILAYLLVRLDVARDRCLIQLAMSLSSILHAWAFSRSAPLDISHYCIHQSYGFELHTHWLGLQDREVVLIEPAVVTKLGATALLFVPDPLPIDLAWMDTLAREFQDHLIVMQSGISDKFNTITGEAGRSLPELWEAVAAGSAVADDERRLASTAFAGLASLRCLGHEVLVARESKDEAPAEPAGPYHYTSSGDVGKGVLLEFGRRTALKKGTSPPRLAAWTLGSTDKKEHAAGLLAKHWLELIGPRGIPIHPKQRQEELRHAYRELQQEIEQWRILTEEENIRRRYRP